MDGEASCQFLSCLGEGVDGSVKEQRHRTAMKACMWIGRRACHVQTNRRGSGGVCHDFPHSSTIIG